MTIEIYVQQLLEDFRVATESVPAEKETNRIGSDKAFLRHIAEVENYLHGVPEKLSKIVGFEKVQLPPLDKLTFDQADRLYAGMEALLATFHFFPDFPQSLPNHLRYSVMRDHWDEEHVQMSMGESHLEFCSYEPQHCPYPAEFCHCRDLQ